MNERKYLFLKKAVELISAVLDPQPVSCINNPNQGISLLKVIVSSGVLFSDQDVVDSIMRARQPSSRE